ncbi:MAG: hypothetical protein KDD53_12045, partial [Bdellovibrionales bacterium]|nr:hypothetical protein [Bdellovibrionales bacterium]
MSGISGHTECGHDAHLPASPFSETHATGSLRIQFFLNPGETSATFLAEDRASRQELRITNIPLEMVGFLRPIFVTAREDGEPAQAVLESFQGELREIPDVTIRTERLRSIRTVSGVGASEPVPRSLPSIAQLSPDDQVKQVDELAEKKNFTEIMRVFAALAVPARAQAIKQFLYHDQFDSLMSHLSVMSTEELKVLHGGLVTRARHDYVVRGIENFMAAGIENDIRLLISLAARQGEVGLSAIMESLPLLNRTWTANVREESFGTWF